jgi:signal transduction histidine kinase/ActR/RegA family two-component response regulator
LGLSSGPMDKAAHQTPASQAFLGAAPAGRWDWRLAMGFVALSFLGFLAIAPLGRVHLAAIPQFVPAYESALWVCDLATALLLLGQFHRSRSPSLLMLSAGYLMSTLIIPAHLMAFPGLFAPNGLFGGTGRSIAWLYVLWHAGFPLFVLGHSLVARFEVRRGWIVSRPGWAILGAVAAALAYVGLCLWLAIDGTFLPVISVNGQYGRMLSSGVAPVMLAIAVAALASIWLGRRGSVLDVWLTAVMSAWICDISLSSILSNTRFDLGWYAGRAYTLMAGAFLFGVLLMDLSRLYGRLADALEDAKAQNAALVRSREELTRAQRMEAVGQLTGGIAHDFNNILTAVTGCLEMIAYKPDDPVRVRQLSRNAARAADRGAQLVRQLLTFSRRQNLNPQVLNANDLLLEMATLARKALGDMAALKLDLGEALERIHVDAGEFQAAILNLLSNARDAMPRGGVVTIRTRNQPAGAKGGPYVVVSVEDTGEGMDAATLARVFEPFFTTKEVGRGTGLGLSQVYGFAESAGGFVDIQSEPGEGSSVSLHLPRTLLPMSKAQPARPPPTPLGARLRILVVEDDGDVIGATAETLRDAGFDVITAATGAEALAVLRSDAGVDLLFTDVMMPGGLDGVELAKAGLKARPNLKVLLTSGYSESLLEARGPLHNLPILAKPYHRDELLNRLQALLRRAGTEGGVVSS